jgi:RimJ/RimL family protein N-acetyltransferase
MEHTLRAEGFGVRLRPVQMADAAFIVWLRNLDHVKGWVGDSAGDVAGQQAWLKAYFERAGDYYFVVETVAGIAVGTYGLYDVAGVRAESGRWIIRPGVPAAVPSGIALLDAAFNKLCLREVHGATVANNHSVLSINRKFGFRQTRLETGARTIAGKAVDLVHFLMTAEDWPKARERLVPLARLAEIQVREWEQIQLANQNACGRETET